MRVVESAEVSLVYANQALSVSGQSLLDVLDKLKGYYPPSQGYQCIAVGLQGEIKIIQNGQFIDKLSRKDV